MFLKWEKLSILLALHLPAVLNQKIAEDCNPVVQPVWMYLLNCCIVGSEHAVVARSQYLEATAEDAKQEKTFGYIAYFSFAVAMVAV